MNIWGATIILFLPSLSLSALGTALIPQMDCKAVFTRNEAAIAVTAQKQFPSNK